jgi:hypothetical protein
LYLVDELNPTGYARAVEELVGGVVQRTYTAVAIDSIPTGRAIRVA